ncbi:uncharacterized protein V6R79_019227 [Siganus canaliculatus]
MGEKNRRNQQHKEPSTNKSGSKFSPNSLARSTEAAQKASDTNLVPDPHLLLCGGRRSPAELRCSVRSSSIGSEPRSGGQAVRAQSLLPLNEAAAAAKTLLIDDSSGASGSDLAQYR